MRDLPDIREEIRDYFELIKATLVKNAQEGQMYAPVCAFVTLTPYGQAVLNQVPEICIVPEWTDDESKKACLVQLVEFCNKYVECIILCGSGHGTYTGLGEGQVNFVFAAIYLPGFNPWTMAQMYTVIEREVLFDAECCSADKNILFFELPGLWPNENAP
jgi:hypothetical protein